MAMIMQPCYRDDFLEILRELDAAEPDVLRRRGLTVDGIAASDKLELLWAVYQKNVSEYDMDPGPAAKDAMERVCGVPAASWTGRRLVYIASPYAGNVEYNVAFAKAAGRLALSMGRAPIVPHLLYPSILDDDVPDERALGLSLNTKLIMFCGELWAFTHKGVTPGMKAEMDFAAANGIPVVEHPETDLPDLEMFLAKPEPYETPAYYRICVTRKGYAVVPADHPDKAVENAVQLGEGDFDWEPVDDELIGDTVEVIEPCTGTGAPIQ